jgi:hypothetical protein
MTPVKIVIELTDTRLNLRVFAPEAQKGSFVIEGTGFFGLRPRDETIELFRKRATRYARKFDIPLQDQTLPG